MRRELLRADCLNMEWVTGWIAKLFGKCGERPEIEIKAGMRGMRIPESLHSVVVVISWLCVGFQGLPADRQTTGLCLSGLPC
jgi:hypothetical protein